jgi:rhodanese-related sulfurtransferase
MTTKKASDLVAEAKSKIENLGVDEFDKERTDGALVVDIRDAPELEASGHIPGSVHVPRGMLEFRADPSSPYHQDGLDPDRRIILHCASGGRSALAAATLKDMGYTDVAHLDGGFKAWSEAGRPVDPA